MKTTRNLFKWLCIFCFCLFLVPVSVKANTMSSAQPISTNGSVLGSLTSTDSVYYYKIALPSSGFLRINNLTSTMSRFGYRLYSSTGTALTSGTLYARGGVPGRGSYGFHLTKGTYYLRLIGNSGSSNAAYYTGSYSFNTSFTSANVNHTETNNNITAAYTISSGKTINGQFSLTDKVDFYKIVLKTPGTLTFKKLFAFQRLGIQIYDSDYQSITGSTSYWDNASGIGSDTTSYYLAAGTYYIRMLSNNWTSSAGNYTGNYQFTVSFASAGVNHAEPSSTFQTASSVTAGKSTVGFIAKNDQVDFYKFTMTKTGTMKIAVASYLQRLGIQIYNSSYSKVKNAGYTMYWDSASKSKTMSKTFTLPKGTYYLRFVGNTYSSSSSFCYGKYRFTLSGNGVGTSSSVASKITVSAISARIYTGKAIRPTVTVKQGSYKLVKGKDYTLSYSNNVNPGKAVITIKGIGNYTGSKQVAFYIKPARQTITALTSPSRRKMTIRYKKAAGVTGYQIYYSLSKNGTYRILKTTTAAAYTRTLALSGRYYYFKVRSYKKVGNQILYGAFSPVKGVKIR